MGLEFLVILVFGFVLTFIITPPLIRRFKRVRAVGIDRHKEKKTEVVELGGFAFLITFLIVISIAIFIFPNMFRTLIAASALSIMLAGYTGVIDYVFLLRDLEKAVLPLAAGVPIIALHIIDTSVRIPFIGFVDINPLIYTWILIPIAFTGAMNAMNMLAGLNGLEVGNGIIILSGLTILSFVTGRFEIVMIGVALLGPLAAFLIYNKYPARAFPGDIGTFTIGAAAATISIIGKLEFFALVMIIPQFIELILKARSGFKAENFGVLGKDNILRHSQEKVYSLTHLFFRDNKHNEKSVVYKLWVFQIVFVLFSMFLFFWAR